ncbi:hypothetical protein [Streptomyces monomycini]|uniref:hypothetical protein n=1 Tax=Streptomyces monomycini TaxID=371720 RepID=UPI0004AA8C5D|nr:hypothetical protein [Streptomyces monomycini]
MVFDPAIARAVRFRRSCPDQGGERSGLDERMVFALLSAFWGSKVRRTVYQRDAALRSAGHSRHP